LWFLNGFGQITDIVAMLSCGDVRTMCDPQTGR
jgi:hypothetical protein